MVKTTHIHGDFRFLDTPVAIQRKSSLGGSIGAVVTLTLAGLLSHSLLSWRSVFYFTSAGGILWFGFWTMFAPDNPEDHQGLQPDERLYFRDLRYNNPEQSFITISFMIHLP